MRRRYFSPTDTGLNIPGAVGAGTYVGNVLPLDGFTSLTWAYLFTGNPANSFVLWDVYDIDGVVIGRFNCRPGVVASSPTIVEMGPGSGIYYGPTATQPELSASIIGCPRAAPVVIFGAATTAFSVHCWAGGPE